MLSSLWFTWNKCKLSGLSLNGIYLELESRGGKLPLILVARFARTNVADYVR